MSCISSNYSYTSAGIVVDDEIPYVWLKRTQSPPLSTSLGVSVTTIPYRFFNFCSYFSAGRMLTVDGKTEMGAELMSTALSIIAEEVNKTIAAACFELMSNSSIDLASFSRKTFPTHIEKIGENILPSKDNYKYLKHLCQS